MKHYLILLLLVLSCLENVFSQTDTLVKPDIKVKKSKLRIGIADSTSTTVPVSQPEKAVMLDSLSRKDALALNDSTKIDTLVKKKHHKHSPLLACILSAAVPGTGQIYNGKWWKTPIAWGLVGGLGYWMLIERKLFKDYRKGYIYKTDDNAATVDLYPTVTEATLKSKRDLARSNFEKAAIFTALAWTMNIVDAFVDAHLKEFDISDDLSMKIKPKFTSPNDIFHEYAGLNIGVGIAFRFK